MSRARERAQADARSQSRPRGRTWLESIGLGAGTNGNLCLRRKQLRGLGQRGAQQPQCPLAAGKVVRRVAASRSTAICDPKLFAAGHATRLDPPHPFKSPSSRLFRRCLRQLQRPADCGSHRPGLEAQRVRCLRSSQPAGLWHGAFGPRRCRKRSRSRASQSATAGRMDSRRGRADYLFRTHGRFDVAPGHARPSRRSRRPERGRENS